MKSYGTVLTVKNCLPDKSSENYSKYSSPKECQINSQRKSINLSEVDIRDIDLSNANEHFHSYEWKQHGSCIYETPEEYFCKAVELFEK